MPVSGGDIAFERAPRRKLAETVARQLLEAARGREPGTRLPSERELVRQLGVGRSTVREALKGLAMIGAVEIRHGQGVFVAAGARAASLGEPRDVVEPKIARLAAEHRTEADLRALEEALAAQREAIAMGASPVLAAARFRLLLAEAADLSELELEPGYAEWELAQHTAIFEAVRDTVSP